MKKIIKPAAILIFSIALSYILYSQVIKRFVKNEGNGQYTVIEQQVLDVWAQTDSMPLQGEGYVYMVPPYVLQGKARFDSIQNKPTTIAGYGIADAYTKTTADGRYLQKSNNLSDISNAGTVRSNIGAQATISTGSTSQYLKGDLSLGTFPTNISSFTNDASYITASGVVPAIGYTPANSATTISINGNTQSIASSRTFNIPDSILFYNSGGRVNKIVKIFADTITVSSSNGFNVDVSAAGFTKVLSASAVAVKNTATATSVPNVGIKSISNTALTLNFTEGNSSVVTLLGSSVLLGPSTSFASTTGLSVYVLVVGY